MAWTAEITNKAISNGLLKVDVSFTDGTVIYRERYETRDPSATWLQDAVKQRIRELKAVIPFADAIVIGVYDPGEDIPVELTDKEKYQKKLNKLISLRYLVDLDIIPISYDEYLNIKQYLIDNFNVNYIV